MTTHLESDYVHDAFVAQVMTGSQLAKVHDLPPERWVLEDLGGDRHLVSATQPERWLDADPRPLDQRPRAEWHYPVEPSVLTQARADFGEAIMTLETLRAHPGLASQEVLDRILAQPPST